MAASIKACLQTNVSTFIRFNPLFCVYNSQKCTQRRFYARGMKRVYVDVETPEQEQYKLRERGFKINSPDLDPTKNPFIEYVKEDPVQTNLKELSRTKKKLNKPKPVIDDSMYMTQNQLLQSSGYKVQKLKKGKYKPELEVPHNSMTNARSFEKLEQGSNIFSKSIMNARTRTQREKKGVVMLEGSRLIKDALMAGAKLKEIFFCNRDHLDDLPTDLDIPLYKVTYTDMKIWSDTKTPPGIIGIFEKPEQGYAFNTEPTLNITIICDQIRDPSNMGTVIRTAAAVGCKRILTIKGCVDAWEPKVLRSGMASHFMIPLYTGLTWERVLNYVPSTSQIVISDTRTPEKISSRFETNNLEELEEIAENREDWVALEREEDTQVYDSSKLSKAMQAKYRNVALQVNMYDEVKYKSDVTVIIGGETRTVSPEAKKLVFDQYGQVITIPIAPAVKSLNNSVAACVLLYEIRRQMCLNLNTESD